jgi:uncharacterized damage-inducible protein DinB
MNWQQLLIDGYERVEQSIKRTLEGLSEKELDRQPSSDTNTIGWLCWHLSRGRDRNIANLSGQDQLWIKDKWYEKFNRPADPADSGFKHTPEQVAAFKSPNTKILLDYHHAVLNRAKDYINSLTETDLDRELDEPWFTPTPTVGVRLISLLEEGLQHSGQAAYLRGLIQGKGWLPI